MKHLYNAKTTKEIDKYLMENKHIPGSTLMENAGRGVYEFIKENNIDTSNTVVVCGKGNNAGDGFVVSRYLAGKNRVIVFYASKEYKKETKIYFDILSSIPRIELVFLDDEGVDRLRKEVGKATLLIDALFGTGFHPPIKGAYREIINIANKAPQILSVDIPSGWDAEYGDIDNGVKPDYVVTMMSYKAGLYMPFGITKEIRIKKVNIGFPWELMPMFDPSAYLITHEDLKWKGSDLFSHEHKNQRGRVAVIGGIEQYPGSVLILANALLRTSGSMLYLMAPKETATAVVSNIPEVMILPVQYPMNAEKVTKTLKNYNIDTVIIGNGWGRGEDKENVLLEIINMANKKEISLLIDADGLKILSKIKEKIKDMDLSNIILTPHIGEMAYLIEKDKEFVLHNRKETLELFDKFYTNALLLLKGQGGLIYHNNNMYLYKFPNSGLSKPGSGDMLAGIIGGIFASTKDRLFSAINGMIIQSEAAFNAVQTLGTKSVLPSDIIEYIPYIIQSEEE